MLKLLIKINYGGLNLINKGIIEVINNKIMISCIEYGLFSHGNSFVEAVNGFKSGLALDIFKTFSINVKDDEIVINKKSDKEIEFNFLNPSFENYFKVVKNNKVVQLLSPDSINFQVKFYRHSKGYVSLLIFFKSIGSAIEFDVKKSGYILINNSPSFTLQDTNEYQISLNYINDNSIYLDHILDKYIKVNDLHFKVNKKLKNSKEKEELNSELFNESQSDDIYQHQYAE